MLNKSIFYFFVRKHILYRLQLKMKYLSLFFGCVLFLACTKDKIGSYQLANTNIGSVLYKGNFYATNGIVVQGVAKIVQDSNFQKLVIDSFSVSSGPDLKVYLSKNDYPSNFINVGALQSFTGNSSYSIPANTNLTEYKYVLIHCQQYDHLFAIAELKK